MSFAMQLLRILILLILFKFGENAIYHLETDESQLILLQANETNIITTNHIKTDDARFIVVQAHSQKERLMLSSRADFPLEFTKEGTNVGLITLLVADQDSGQWFMRTNSTSNITVSVIIQLYTDMDPIPGGCNQVFNLELDPSIELDDTRPYRTRILYQWANLAAPIGFNLPNCENKKVASNIHYDVYIYFMQQQDLGEAQFFSSLDRMLKIEDILKHGTKILSTSETETTKSNLLVSSRAGQGVIYSIVARRHDTGRSASYTSAATYNCDLSAGTCDDNVQVAHILLAIVLAIIGIAVLFFGHAYFKATQVLFGFVFCFGIVYIGVSNTDMDGWVSLVISVIAGAAGGGLWLAVWHRFQFPVMQVFLMGLCAGYIVTSVVFFTPFGNISWFESAVNYALVFVVINLFFVVSLMVFAKLLSILSCCILGSTLVSVCVAIPLWGSLEMVFLNALYHQTSTSYHKVIVAYPLKSQDIILYTVWAILTFVGFIFQWWRERGHSSFTKPFETMRSHLLQHHRLPQHEQYTYTGGTPIEYDYEEEQERYNTSGSHSRAESEDTHNGERTKLLSHHPGYAHESDTRYRSTQQTEPATPSAPVQDPEV